MVFEKGPRGDASLGKDACQPRPLGLGLNRLIKPPRYPASNGVVPAVEHVEMPVAFEFGEGQDLSVFFGDQGAAPAHPQVPNFRVRNLWCPGPNLLIGIVFQVD